MLANPELPNPMRIFPPPAGNAARLRSSESVVPLPPAVTSSRLAELTVIRAAARRVGAEWVASRAAAAVNNAVPDTGMVDAVVCLRVIVGGQVCEAAVVAVGGL